MPSKRNQPDRSADRPADKPAEGASPRPRRRGLRGLRGGAFGLTEREHLAWATYERLGSTTEVGRELGITRQAAGALVASARRKLDAAGIRPPAFARRHPPV